MNDRNDTLFRNTIVIAIGTFSTKILSFLLIPFYTMWLTTEEYGNYDFMVTYISLIIPFITFQLEQAIFRFVFENKDKNPKKYLNNAMHIILLNMIVANIALFLILKNNSFYLPFMLFFNTNALYIVMSEYLRGIGKLKNYSFNNIVVSIFIVIFNFIFVYFLKKQVNGMLISYALAYGIGVCTIVVFEKLLSKGFFSDNDKSIKKEMLRYSLPLIPNSISWWITNVSDRTIIKYVLGSAYNGIYAISCKIPIIVNLFFSVFNLSWQQSAIEAIKDKDKKQYYNSILINLIKFLYTSSFVILAFTPCIFNFFINKNYYNGIYQIPILLNGVILLSIGQFLSGIFLANKDTKNVGISTVLAACANLMINLFLCRRIGLYAASLSTFISYGILFLVRFIKLKTNFNVKLVIKKIILYNSIFAILSAIIFIKNIFLISIVMLLSVICFIVLNKNIEIMIINKFLWRKKNESTNN